MSRQFAYIDQLIRHVPTHEDYRQIYIFALNDCLNSIDYFSKLDTNSLTEYESALPRLVVAVVDTLEPLNNIVGMQATETMNALAETIITVLKPNTKTMQIEMISTPTLLNEQQSINHAEDLLTNYSSAIEYEDNFNTIVNSLAKDIYDRAFKEILSICPLQAADGNYVDVMTQKILDDTNLVAARTRRGAGNVIVVSPAVLTGLQAANGSSYDNSSIAEHWLTEQKGPLKLAGILNGRIKVYCWPFFFNGECIITYKGSSKNDAGLIYMLKGFFHQDEDEDYVNTQEIFIPNKSPASMISAADYFSCLDFDTTDMFMNLIKTQ